MRATIAMTLLVGASGCFSVRGGAVSIRPIRVTVIDARTREPLPDIAVWYALETSVQRPKLLGVIPSPIEPQLGTKLAHVIQTRTDAHGEVSFALPPYPLPGNELLAGEDLFVNLGVDMTHPVARSEAERAVRAREGGSPYAADVPPEAWVAWRSLLKNPAQRAELFRNPEPKHRGVVVLGVSYASCDGCVDWTTPGDRFRVQWNLGSLRRKSDAVTVSLEPWPEASP